MTKTPRTDWTGPAQRSRRRTQEHGPARWTATATATADGQGDEVAHAANRRHPTLDTRHPRRETVTRIRRTWATARRARRQTADDDDANVIRRPVRVPRK